MKKTLLALAALFTTAITLWAESPSLDGRALVADEGVFPRGLFAKTVGYLPGDSISVTNPANGERVDILVIGSLDPSEGVAVLLSPEAASALNIRKNANNLVKLTKRSGGADEICNGSAVLTNGAYCPPQEGDAVPEKTVSEVVQEALDQGVPVEEAVAEAVEEAEENIADKEFDKAEEEIAETEREEAVAEADSESGSEDAASETEEPEEIAEVEEESGEEYPQYEEPVVDELAQTDESEAADDFVEANVIDEPLDEYEAIVLVPSESKAPESAASEEPEAEVEPEPVQESIAQEPLSAQERSAGVAYLNGYGELESQKYYVQIASCSKSETVEQLAAQYAGRYPIAVVQGGERSPVLVGPLTIDEYGVVLERFKAYGFKDAFVRQR